MKTKRTEFARWVVLYRNGTPADWTVSETRKDAISKFIDGVDGMPWETHFRPAGYRCVKCQIKLEIQ